MEKVAGFLEVSLIDNGQNIVIKVPGLKPDVNGADRIVLSPRYARHLANLLIEHAMIAEAQLDDSLCRARQSPNPRGDGKSSG